MKHDNDEVIAKMYQPKDYAGKLALIFLRNPLTMVLGFFLIAIGYISLIITPREENPQMIISGSTVIIALPGATSKEVENVIIKPLERKLKEVKGIEHIYGIAMDSFAVINATFHIGELKEDSNLKIYDKIMQNMDIFPKGIMMPIIKPLDIDTDIPIVTVAFYSKDKNMPLEILYDRVRDIQYQINGVPNVAVTNLKGGKRHQFNILVDQNKLAGYNISMGQILKSVESLAHNIPDFKGRISDGKIAIMSVKNGIETEKDLENIIVAKYGDSSVYLKDIAHVELGNDFQNFQSAHISYRSQHSDNFSELNDQVTLTVSKLQGTNAVTIANAVKDELNINSQIFEENGIGYVITRNDGERANEAVNELVFHLILSIVIIAILLVFVLGWRESLIVTFTVPAILSVTLFVAYLTDQTINRITLFAFLLALGLLVDAAIIVIENIHRHLHSKHGKNKSIDEIMVQATDEIGPPTNIATLAIILTMIPMAFVGQMMGQFMQPIPANVPVALVASLFVAYIFTPYLSARMLKKDHNNDEEHKNV
jgi:multidrug efflux pump subunit AcrB